MRRVHRVRDLTRTDHLPQQSLLQSLDLQQLNCLNETAQNNVKDLLASRKLNTNESLFVLSDADEQLLINIPVSAFHPSRPFSILLTSLSSNCIQFIRSVRIKSLVIKSKGEPGQQPRKIKLFINRPSLGFEDVQDAEEPDASQIIELTDAQVTQGKKIPLRFVRFQNVNSIHVRTPTGKMWPMAEYDCPSDLCGYERRRR